MKVWGSLDEGVEWSEAANRNRAIQPASKFGLGADLEKYTVTRGNTEYEGETHASGRLPPHAPEGVRKWKYFIHGVVASMGTKPACAPASASKRLARSRNTSGVSGPPRRNFGKWRLGCANTASPRWGWKRRRVFGSPPGTGWKKGSNALWVR